MDRLVNYWKGNGSKLERLQKHIETLQNVVTIEDLSTEAECQLQNLLNLSEFACKTIPQQRILDNLTSGSMPRKFDSIPEAQQETFRWMFDREDARNLDCSGPKSFRNWLSSDEVIFHIAGKLGRGKSTLMQFLCEHRGTQAGLKEWADGRKVVFAKFFFWKSGSQLERSLEGLYRSLLHRTLKACPEIIPDVMPVQWNEVKSMPWQDQTQLDIGAKETREAFVRLISHPTLNRYHCFCYFIDGINEYEETPQEDYEVMVKPFLEWVTLSQGGVEVCVSSREDGLFLNAFSHERRIRLQNLTRRVMQKYVREPAYFHHDAFLELSDRNWHEKCFIS